MANNSRCEHAQCLMAHTGTLASPLATTETVLEKVAYDSAVYSNFHELVRTLKAALAPVDMHTPEHVETIKSLLRRVRINEKEWRQYTNWKDNRYTRNLVGFDEKFTALILCWNKKQASPIHDHAGSSCWVKCLHGCLTETLYDGHIGPDGCTASLTELGKNHAHANEVCYINDSIGLHRMENENADDVCVTLHIYSPPYQFCNAYNMDGTKRMVSMLAANAPYSSFFDGMPRNSEGMALQPSVHFLGLALQRIGLVPVLKFEAASMAAPRSRASSKTPAVTAVPAFVEAEADKWKAAVLHALTRTVVSEKDWQQYTHFSDHRYTRSMVYSDDNFSVLILCWMPGQSTPLHTHGKGTHSWFRVLCGNLDLKFFNDQRCLTSTMSFDKESPPFFESEGRTMHQVCNSSDSCVAVSLHVYSPPYKQLSYDDPATRTTSTLPIVHCDGEAAAIAAARRRIMSSTDDIVAQMNASPITPTMMCSTPVSSSCRACCSQITATEIVFTNFQTMGELLNREFSIPRVDDAARCAAVMSLLERCTFHGDEVDALRGLTQRAGNQLLLHTSPDFTVELVFWSPEYSAASSIHDHDNSFSWIKVLGGRLSEVLYRKSCMQHVTSNGSLISSPDGSFPNGNGTTTTDSGGAPLELCHSSLLMTDAVSFLGKNTLHSLRNGGVCEAVSLHITSPPATCSNKYSMCGRSVKQFFVFAGETGDTVAAAGIPPMEHLELSS
ncbi:cysteine dioxygenase, putative [Bodo saltans]|uniref:cysteine dioxygenase n=1 Tax=Bodo saltans TaxID=75058 RepID=A0A0S4JCJ4_BODSA|nr:cysteine dioxygenase, putative [Bodo saltans]|eukprot:CUG86630.1 cysteine dioxygenase, putative [Bodo saltans]